MDAAELQADIETAPRPAYRGAVVALIALAVAVVAGVACFAANMGADEGIWNCLGLAWVRYDQVPYRDIVDDKTPGIFILFAASVKLFGVNVWFPRLLGCLATVAGSLVVYRIARNLLDYRAGIFAMGLFGLSMSWWLMDGPFAAQTETFMVLFELLAVLALIAAQRARRARQSLAGMFAAGLAIGFAISFKQIAIFSAAGLFLFYLCVRKRGRFLADSVLACAGVLVAVGISLIPLLAGGVGVWEYIQGAWLVYFGPVAVSYSTSAADRVGGFVRAWLQTGMIMWAPLLCLFAFQNRRARAVGVPVAGIGLWVLFDFMGVNTSGNYYGHQFKQVVAPLAIASGIAISLLIRRFARSKSQSRWLGICALATIAIFFLPYESLRRALISGPPEDYPRMLGAWVRDRTDPDDYVFVAGDSGSGGTQVLAYSHRPAASRYFFWTFLALQPARRTVLDDFAARRPRFVLWHKNSSYQLPPWLADEFESMTRRSYQRLPDKFGYAILERRDEQRD
ncbi:MAG: glycosyltransferase family 39 protein, partial [Phycisphaerae bacterium]|nr:glycosyltransferase family 39 protein [Phycisphaerae bacterium]